MEIEEGKYYVSRDSRVWGPIKPTNDGNWKAKRVGLPLDPSVIWNRDGSFLLQEIQHGFDLVREATEGEIRANEPWDNRIQDYTIQLLCALITANDPEVQGMSWDAMLAAASSLAEKVVKGVGDGKS